MPEHGLFVSFTDLGDLRKYFSDVRYSPSCQYCYGFSFVSQACSFEVYYYRTDGNQSFSFTFDIILSSKCYYSISLSSAVSFICISL